MGVNGEMSHFTGPVLHLSCTGDRPDAPTKQPFGGGLRQVGKELTTMLVPSPCDGRGLKGEGVFRLPPLSSFLPYVHFVKYLRLRPAAILMTLVLIYICFAKYLRLRSSAFAHFGEMRYGGRKG
jgi:hypothetical protein